MEKDGNNNLVKNQNMKTILLLLFPIFAFGQVQDSTLVAVDTTNAVKQLNRFEISKNQQVYTIKQFQDDVTFVQTQVTGKREAVNRLTAILKQLNSDEALLLKQLVIVRERKKEIKTARDLYK